MTFGKYEDAALKNFRVRLKIDYPVYPIKPRIMVVFKHLYGKTGS